MAWKPPAQNYTYKHILVVLCTVTLPIYLVSVFHTFIYSNPAVVRHHLVYKLGDPNIIVITKD